MRLGIKKTGYPIRVFEIAFLHNFKEVDGKVPNHLRRRRVLRRMLSGKAHYKDNAYIERLEEFTNLMLNIGKKKK
jgi:hypothetical protein